MSVLMAEAVGFEPTRRCRLPDFESFNPFGNKRNLLDVYRRLAATKNRRKFNSFGLFLAENVGLAIEPGFLAIWRISEENGENWERIERIWRELLVIFQG